MSALLLLACDYFGNEYNLRVRVHLGPYGGWTRRPFARISCGGPVDTFLGTANGFMTNTLSEAQINLV